MPNWCMNKVEFNDKPQGIEEFLIKADSGAFELDGMKLMPPPGGEYDYDWCLGHWGSKWSPIELKLDGLTMTFDSAWSPPIGLIATLCGRLKVSATMRYYEPGMCLAGLVEISADGGIFNETDYGPDDIEYEEIAINDFNEEVGVFTDGLGGESPIGLLESVAIHAVA